MSQITYENIAIIGLGLIGSSVARACKQYNVANNIIAYDSNPLTLQLGEQQGFVSKACSSIEEAVKNADLVVIATPPSVSLEIVPTIAKHLPKDALVTDVVSVKSPISAAFKEHLADYVAIPSHPIAGSEQTGAAAGKADLFAGKRVILTPETPEDEGIERLSDFWEALGGVIEYMPPDVHDMVYAYVSHMPQLLAFGYAPHAKKMAMESEVPEYFEQFTRLCHSDKHLWDDIFTQNKQHLDTALARFLVLLGHIRAELAEENPEGSDERKVPEAVIWTHWVPRLIASCMVASVAQQSRDAGFNFSHFAGSGFADFTAPLTSAPEVEMEAISQCAPQVVEILDELLNSLSDFVVIKE